MMRDRVEKQRIIIEITSKRTSVEALIKFYPT